MRIVDDPKLNVIILTCVQKNDEMVQVTILRDANNVVTVMVDEEGKDDRLLTLGEKKKEESTLYLGTCSRKGCGNPSSMETCPYANDVKGKDVQCGCCDSCQKECAQDI